MYRNSLEETQHWTDSSPDPLIEAYHFSKYFATQPTLIGLKNREMHSTLLRHSTMELEADGALMTGSDAESVRWGGTTRGRTLLKSDSRFCVKFCGRSKPIIHYPVFITTKERTSKVSLFSKWIFHFPFVHDLAYTINLCLPWQRRQKCMLVFRNVYFRNRVVQLGFGKGFRSARHQRQQMPLHFI